jgi:hypothetical protein
MARKKRASGEGTIRKRPNGLWEARLSISFSLLSNALSIENASSIGEKSGEYAGRNRSSQPRASTDSLTRSPLCAERLSRTTTCPGRSAGATGNVSSEDLVRMLGLMGVRSGVDLGAVLALARGVRETVGYPLESAVLRAGKAGDLHEPPGSQVLMG